MVYKIDDFVKSKDFLICVDSDGCAMDTMDEKHIKCFGPCMITQWELSHWETDILKHWNKVNLYSMTRGINRFLGLCATLQYVNETFCAIDGIDVFANWCNTSKELSNQALRNAIEQGAHPIFERALAWSTQVNCVIEQEIGNNASAFSGVVNSLRFSHAFANVAVVSSANKEAVEQEWQQNGLSQYVDMLCCQDLGSKAHCIQELMKKGYEPSKVLMVGDAPGDLDAAEKNGVFFYPILVGHEIDSWQELQKNGFEKLKENAQPYFEENKHKFYNNLK